MKKMLLALFAACAVLNGCATVKVEVDDSREGYANSKISTFFIKNLQFLYKKNPKLWLLFTTNFGLFFHVTIETILSID